MIDLDMLVIESLQEQREKKLESENHRILRLPIPQSPILEKKEKTPEPKRVIIIDL